MSNRDAELHPRRAAAALGVSRGAQLERERLDRKRRAAREAADVELAEAYLRAVKDRGDTDGWAATVLHSAGIHQIDLGDGTIVPVPPPPLKVVR